jgi:YegS/Rv2252/BmrU family lipid kinase
MSGKNKAPRACLIVNARSGDSTFNLDDALLVLLTQGWKVDVREKREKGDAAKLARAAAEDGYDPIVSCGGDGTLNEIVDALAGSDVAVGTIPGGTENVWSKQVGISQRTRVATTQLVSGYRVRVDVGRVTINDKHRHHFLMMAGLGADGAVMQRVSRSLKNRLGPLAVGVAAVEALPALGRMRVQIEMDGVRWDGEIAEMIVGNTRDYGGFTRVTSDALIDDGLLDICLFTTDGILPAARQMASLLVRQHPSDASSEMYRAAKIELRTPQPLALQLDGSDVTQGEKDGEAVYQLDVLPRGLTVIVPRTYDGELFEHGVGLDGAGRASKGKKRRK